jgi:hypothetical protein
MANMFTKSSGVVALIIVPLLIAAAITYWPSERIPLSTVVILPPDLHSQNDVSGLAEEIPAALAGQLENIPRLRVEVTDKAIDAEHAAAFDAVVITTLTEDAGIVQLNIQVVNPGTRREIWSNSYQSSRGQFSEMLRVAGEGMRRALD